MQRYYSHAWETLARLEDLEKLRQGMADIVKHLLFWNVLGPMCAENFDICAPVLSVTPLSDSWIARLFGDGIFKEGLPKWFSQGEARAQDVKVSQGSCWTI